MLYLQKPQVIANKSLHIRELRNAFAHGKSISVDDLIRFYKRFEETISRSTVDWRIYELNQQGILHRVARGTYSLSETNTFIPDVTLSMKQLYGSIRKQFPFAESCIWTTRWINEFMLHQPGRFYTIIEVEKDVMESVFFALKEQGKEVFLDPSDEVLNKYVIDTREPVIVTRLTSESPILKIDNVNTVTLEKILVDLLCDEKLFAAQQGAELERIYRTAFEKYTVSTTKLLRYASRRSKKEEIEKRIEKIQRNGNND